MKYSIRSGIRLTIDIRTRCIHVVPPVRPVHSSVARPLNPATTVLLVAYLAFDIVAELRQGGDPGHFFRLDLEAELLFHNHH